MMNAELAKTVRNRLSGHGDVIAHQNGTFTLHLMRLWGENWAYRLKQAILSEYPNAKILRTVCRPHSDRMFEHHEIIFRPNG